MKKSEKAKIVLDVIKYNYDLFHKEYISAKCDLAAVKASSLTWIEYAEDKDNGVGTFGNSNPYNSINTETRLNEKEKEFQDWKEVLEFANNVFLDMIDGE